MNRPPLYAGRALPFGLLEPSEWERFVYATMGHLASKRGATVEGGPANSTDDGFDTWLRRDQDSALVCVRCKRLKEPLGAPLVATELAKVAMRSALERSDVREHYFVTTGGVTKELPRLRRETGWATLRGNAIAAALNNPEFEAVRGACRECGLDVSKVVGAYVDGLDTLLVWSGQEYEEQLTSVWSKLSDILEKYFALDTVIRERPRPDLDVAAYIQRLAADHRNDWIELDVAAGALPDGIRVSSGEDPLGEPPRSYVPASEDDGEGDDEADVPTTIVEAVLAAAGQACSLLIAPGGGGKSTAGRMAVTAAARLRLDEPERRIPILLPLGSYRGDLTSLVHRVLGITYGHWKSLSGAFLLVGDGLDEVPPEHCQALVDELEAAMRCLDIATVLTLRDGGLRRAVVLRTAGHCWSARPLTIRQIHQLAEARLGAHLGAEFLRQLRPRLSALGAAIFSLPFGVAAALQIFERSRQLPSTAAALLDSVVEARIARNGARVAALPESLRQTPASLIRTLARELAFEFRVVRQRARLERAEAEAAVACVLARLQDSGTFGAAALTDIDAWTLSAHYESLVLAGDTVSVGHDLVADHLAGRLLAERWREHREHLQSVVGQDSWVFGAAHLPEQDVSAFMESVREVDLLLAARCAVESGPSAVAYVEPHAIAAIDGANLFSLSSGIAAAAVLGTEELVEKLHWCVAYGTRQQRERSTEMLAAIGDPLVVGQILDAADRFASGPFNASGGEISTWHRVPGNVAVALARQRLASATPESLVALSIETIHMFGERTDFELVQRVMLATKHQKVYDVATSCLHALNPERAREVLAARVGPLVTPSNLHDARLLHWLGGSVSVSAGSLRLLLSPGSYEGVEPLRTLCQLPLANDARQELRRMFDEGTVDRSALWQLAAAHGVPEFDELAWAVLHEGESEAYGYAARFALKRGWDDPTLVRFAEQAIARAREVTSDPGSARWHLEQLLDLSLKAGLRLPVAELLAYVLPGWIERHLELGREAQIRRSVPEGQRPPLSGDHGDFYLESGLPHLVTYAARVGASLPAGLIRQCVHLSMRHADDTSRAAYGGLLRFLGSDELDDELESIEDPYERLPALASAATHCGLTERRVNGLKLLIPEWFNVAAQDRYLANAITALWREDVLTVLVDTIAEEAWDPRYSFQMGSSTTGVVIRRLSPDLVDRVVAPAVPRAKTGAARELLELWCGVGKRRQVAANI